MGSLPMEDMEKARKETASGAEEKPPVDAKIPEIGYFYVMQQLNSLSQQINNVQSNLRQELKQDITELRQELKQDITGLRQEFKQDIAALKQDIIGLRQELKDELNNTKQELKQDVSNLKSEITKLRLWYIGTLIAVIIAAVGWVLSR